MGSDEIIYLVLKFQEVCVDLGLHVVSLQRKSKSLSSY